MNIKKQIALLMILSLLVSCLVSPNRADAMRRTGSDVSRAKNTYGVLSVITDLDPTTPLATTCKMVSKGQSILGYSSSGTGYKKTTNAHTINATVGGWGGGSISSAGGVVATSSSKSINLSTSADEWYYTISSTIWRLLSYNEDHSVQYIIKKGTKTAAVNLAVSIIY